MCSKLHRYFSATNKIYALWDINLEIYSRANAHGSKEYYRTNNANIQDVVCAMHPYFYIQIYDGWDGRKLFLISPTQDGRRSVLELLLQELVHSERDSLAWGHTHNSRRDAFVEGMESFLSSKRKSAEFSHFLIVF